jgi:hypothetical protein
MWGTVNQGRHPEEAALEPRLQTQLKFQKAGGRYNEVMSLRVKVLFLSLGVPR